MTVDVEGAQPSIVLNERLQGQLATLGAGRVLVIGYFASCRCGVVVGDFSISWRKAAPGPGYVEQTPIAFFPFVDGDDGSRRFARTSGSGDASG